MVSVTHDTLITGTSSVGFHVTPTTRYFNTFGLRQNHVISTNSCLPLHPHMYVTKGYPFFLFRAFLHANSLPIQSPTLESEK